MEGCDSSDSDLKESRSETWTRSAGSLFQRTMVMGENEYL